MPVLTVKAVGSCQDLAHLFKLLPCNLTERETPFKYFERCFLKSGISGMSIMALVIRMIHQMH